MLFECQENICRIKHSSECRNGTNQWQNRSKSSSVHSPKTQKRISTSINSPGNFQWEFRKVVVDESKIKPVLTFEETFTLSKIQCTHIDYEHVSLCACWRISDNCGSPSITQEKIQVNHGLYFTYKLKIAPRKTH